MTQTAQEPDTQLWVRPFEAADVLPVIRLYGRLNRRHEPLPRSLLLVGLEEFSEGQMVAMETSLAADGGERLVGAACARRVGWNQDPPPDWKGCLATAEEEAKAPDTLFSILRLEEPAGPREAVRDLLLEAQQRQTTEMGLAQMVTAAPLNGYALFAAEEDPNTYLERVLAGHRHDPALAFYLERDFVPAGIVAGYPGGGGDEKFGLLLSWASPTQVN
ncbi:MAG: hypothetical protein AAF604_05940 [Acidobacteriota bacterium]